MVFSIVVFFSVIRERTKRGASRGMLIIVSFQVGYLIFLYCRFFGGLKQNYVKNLMGGGAAGGAPVPQLGLPHPGAGPGPE